MRDIEKDKAIIEDYRWNDPDNPAFEIANHYIAKYEAARKNTEEISDYYNGQLAAAQARVSELENAIDNIMNELGRGYGR